MATKNIVPRLNGEGGIGTATKGWGKLFITNTTTSSATEGANLTLAANDGAVMGDNHRLGVIEFKGAEDVSNTLSTGARIQSIARGAWGGSDNDADLEFYTTDGTTESKVLTLDPDKIATFAGTITTEGALGINIHSSASSSSGTGAQLNLTTDDGAAMGSGHRVGVITFRAAEDGGSTLTSAARIESITSEAWSASANHSYLSFYTSYTNAAISENVRIGGLTAMDVYNDYDTEPFEDQLNDNEGGGEILRYGSGQAGAIGTLHFLHTDGSWDVCDASDVATGGSQLLGIAMGTDPGTDGMLLKGYYKVASGNIDGAAAIGAPVYVADDSTGEFDFDPPSDTGEFVRIIGYCIDIDSSDILLYFNPDSTFVEIT